MQEAYVFFGGKRIANRVVSSGAISYYAEDFIGSSRVITTSAGATCYDGDFYPYGSESNVTNTCPQNYKWTGKERDAETGNDDFDARYYSPVYGRFLSADWSAVPVAVPYANLTNPQTLNLYAIVRDNPESFVDLDGHLWTPGGAGQCGDATSGCGGSDQNAAANTTQKAEQNQKAQQSQVDKKQLATGGAEALTGIAEALTGIAIVVLILQPEVGLPVVAAGALAGPGFIAKGALDIGVGATGGGDTSRAKDAMDVAQSPTKMAIAVANGGNVKQANDIGNVVEGAGAAKDLLTHPRGSAAGLTMAAQGAYDGIKSAASLIAGGRVAYRNITTPPASPSAPAAPDF